MSIKRTIITAIVGLTLVAVVAPGVAQGVTIDELMAQIGQLQAQLTALQPGATPVPTGNVACAGVTFTRNLVVGSTGSDVKCLQVLLNNNGFTLAQTGAGSPGMETSYFGPRTLAVVRAFQVAKGWTPANQVGPLTRAALNALINSWTSGTPITTLPQGCTSTSGFSPITGASCATGVINIVPTGAGLAVQLAVNNPAAGTIVDGQALAPLARLVFVNGDNAEVKITGLKLKRTGISADASLTNTYLFDGAVRLTDGASVSSTLISFNVATGIFTVPAGGSKTISVLADVDGTSGETVGVQITTASDVTSNSSTIRGIFPVSGNLMNIATGTLASVVFNTTTTPAESSVDPQNDYTVFQNSAVVYTRAVDLNRISFRKTGSVAVTDLQNFRLYIDGVQVGSNVQNLNSEGYLTFDLSAAPKRMEAGTRVVKVLADIIGGSNLNFTFNLWSAADVTVVDSQYGANILVESVADGTAFTKRSTGQQSVNSGTISFIKKTDSPSGNIVDGASNATLAKFEVKAAGEPIKIETLYISAVVSDASVGYLRNGMLLANGVQIGSTSNLYDNGYTTAYTTFNLGSSLIVTPGSPVTLEVKADIYDNDGTDDLSANDTIKIRIEGANWNNAEGRVSAATIDAPAADVDANTVTVKTGGLTLSNYAAYTAQVAVAPLTAYKLAWFTLTANTTEAVNLTAINVALDDVSSYASNLYVTYGVTGATPKTTNTKATVAATNSWSINETLPAGATFDVMVYADISSLAAGNMTGIATVDIDGTTANSATSADSTEVTGQSTTFSTGTFAEAFSSAPLAQIVAGGNSLSNLQVIEAARYQLTSSYQEYTISEMRFSVASDTIAGAIINAILKDGATVLDTVPYDSTNDYFNFTGLNIVVPASTTKTITLAYTLSLPSSSAGTSGVDIKPTLTYVKRMDPSGTVTEDSGLTYAANSTIVYRAIPILSSNSLPTTSLANTSEADLASVNVKASKGDVSVKQFKFAVSWSDGGTTAALNMANLKLFREGSDITSSVTIVSEDGYSAEGSGGISEGDGTVVVKWDGDTADTITAEDTVTYVLKGTPTNFGSGATDTAGSDAISFALTRDSAVQTAGHDYLNLNDGVIIGLHDSAASVTSSAEEANFIWSDMSAVGHASGATSGAVGTSSTDDWTNSYMVVESLSSQTRSR